MRMLIAVVGLVLAAGWTALAADDDAAKAAKKLEGKYEVVSATRGGKPEPKAAEVKSFVIKDGEIIMDSGTREEKAKFTLDPSKTPAEIDIKPTNEAVKGIYKTKETDKGLELTIAFTKSGKDGSVRPKDFKGEGADEVVISLLRKK